MTNSPEPMPEGLEHLDARQIAMLQAMGMRVWSRPATVSAMPVLNTSPVEPQTSSKATPSNNPTPFNPNPTAAPVPSQTKPAAVFSPPSNTPITNETQRASHLSWADLRQAVSTCGQCGLCKHRKNTVFGVGADNPASPNPPKVDWLLLGEAPGEQEDLEGVPFVGQAGKLLDNMLGCLGLSRNSSQGGSVYITNTLKCRPPANRNPSPEESTACAPWLARQIALLQPKLIVAMGRFAAHSLLADSVPDIEKIPLGKLRGQIHRYRNTPVVVTYHPAYLLRSLPDKARAWEDWVLAAQNVKS
jgi:uracil-DNA glycosylase